MVKLLMSDYAADPPAGPFLLGLSCTVRRPREIP